MWVRTAVTTSLLIAAFCQTAEITHGNETVQLRVKMDVITLKYSGQDVLKAYESYMK